MTAASFPVIDLHRTGHRIECQRRAAGLSVRELQQYFGFEYPQAIYKWQHGECLPTVDNLLALSRILHVGMEDLLVYEDQEVHFFFCAKPVPFVIFLWMQFQEDQEVHFFCAKPVPFVMFLWR